MEILIPLEAEKLQIPGNYGRTAHIPRNECINILLDGENINIGVNLINGIGCGINAFSLFCNHFSKGINAGGNLPLIPKGLKMTMFHTMESIGSNWYTPFFAKMYWDCPNKVL